MFVAAPQVVKEDDNKWPEPDRVGKQELEVILNGQHISFTCTKLGSVLQVGLRVGI
jgi:protein mago nashi